ncbi:nonstructural protein 1 [Galliform chaphamaparvovirus 10]|nr:nonstructural protein 1 [Galliform chaphamaparvovirus 10]
MQEEMGSPGERYGIFLWVGSKSTGGDLNRHQAQAQLIEKEFMRIPVPEVEKACHLYNMKEWQCCILQICFSNADPIIDPIAYSLTLNQLSTVSDWVITGEFNENKIFHTHCMLRCNARSDSVKRSLDTEFSKLKLCSNFISMFGQDCTIDCLKIQRCHKPESMFQYQMKDPMWLMSNTERLLELCYNIDAWNLNERFKTKQDISEPEMQEISKTIVDIIMKHSCKTVPDIMRADPNAIAKFLHKPGLQQIISNCLTFVEATAGTWDLALYDLYDPNPEVIHKVLLHQGIKPSEFDPIFHKWITKSESKRNTILIQGPSDTGKSTFIQGLKACVSWGEIVNGANGFNFEGLLGSTIGIWEEPLCSPELAEKVKQVLEGMPTSVPVKYRKPHMLPRTPIMITTNHDLWRFCSREEDAMRNRMHIFFFNYSVKNSNYYPRTSEHGCKCRYCTASCGGSPPHGESSTCRVQRAKQPLSPGEHGSIRTEHPSADVCSGSVRDSGEGTSGSYDRPCSSSSSSTELERSDSSGHPISTSSSAVVELRCEQPRPSHSGDGMDLTKSQSSEYVEPDEPRPSTSRGGDGAREHSARQQFFQRHFHGARHHKGKHYLFPELGPVEPPSKKAKEISIHTKQSRVDRILRTKMNIPIKIPMYPPLKQDWLEYLSYIYHIYG